MPNIFEGLKSEIDSDRAKRDQTNISISLPTTDENTPYEPQRTGTLSKPQIDVPSTFESIKHAVAQSEWTYPERRERNVLQLDSPYDEAVPDGWKIDPSLFDGLNDNYANRLLEATGPKDAQRLQYYLMQRQQEDEHYSNGSFLAKGIEMLLPEPSMLLLGGALGKAAKVGGGIFEKAAYAVPGAAASAIMHEAAEQTSIAGGNLYDGMTNAFSETMATSLLLGGGYGLSKAFKGGELFLWSKTAIKAGGDGISFNPVLNEQGDITSLKAVPEPGRNVGAAQVDFYQKFADSRFHKGGLFAVPLLGGYLGKGAAVISPKIRMLNSEFDEVAVFADRSASHGFITKGITEGRESPDKFEDMMGQLMGENFQYQLQLKGLHKERNGLEIGNKDQSLSDKAKALFGKGLAVDDQVFNKEIIDNLRYEMPSDKAPVNEAASISKRMMLDVYEPLRAAYGFSEKITPPPGSEGYFPIVYNNPELTAEPTKWESMSVAWHKEADDFIRSELKPIDDLKQKISVEVDKKNKRLLIAQRKKLEEDLQDKIRTGTFKLKNGKNARYDLLADDRSKLSATEARQLEQLFEPLNKLEKELASEVDAVKKRVIEEKIEQERFNLQEKAINGQIDPVLFDKSPEGIEVKFKNAKERLKFRPLFESEYHMQLAANHTRNKILNQTVEDTMHDVFNEQRGVREGTNSLMARTHMIPTSYLDDNNFLHNDVFSIVASYRNMMARKLFMKQIYNDVSIDGGIEPIIKRLHDTFMSRENALIEKMKTAEKNKNDKLKKEINKQRAKLKKSFEQGKSDIGNLYRQMSGKMPGTPKQREFFKSVRALACGTRLGGVPLTMIGDASGVVFKQGFWPTIRSSILPMLKTLDGLLKTKEGENWKKNANSAGIGFNHMGSPIAERNFSGFAQPFEPMSNVISNGLHKFAHATNLMAGTALMENGLQRWAAGSIQDKIIRYALAHAEGKLSKADNEKLLLYGLDLNKWGKRIIAGWEDAGKDGDGFGGYHSNYWKWNDVEASNRVSMTVYRGVKDAVIRRGYADAPFFMDDPWASTLFLFKGFLAAANNRFLFPLMQKPDVEKIVGMFMMLGAGAMINPLRRLVKGESPIQEDEPWFTNALTESMIFSGAMDVVQIANGLSGGAVLGGNKNERFKNRAISGLLGGPVIGLMDDITRTAGKALTSNMKENDLKRLFAMTPPLQLWYLRSLGNKGAEQFGLEK